MTSKTENPIVKILIAAIGALGLIIVALISYSASIKSGLLPIEATQTAEAFHTSIVLTNQANQVFFTSTPTMLTSSRTPMPDTPVPTNIPTQSIAQLGCVELLQQSWQLEGTGAQEAYEHDTNPNVLMGKNSIKISYDLHGLNALPGDASAIIFDQPFGGAWHFISLSEYGRNGFDGLQSVDISLSDFADLNSDQPVGTLHTRFWHTENYVVDIVSVMACEGNVLLLEEGKNFISDEYSSESPCLSNVNLARPVVGTFTLEYEIPVNDPTDNCYAGFDMDLFPQPFDGSVYRVFEFSILFSDPEATCIVIFTDTNDQEERYLIPAEVKTTAIQNAQTFTIPLDYFARVVNLRNLSKITFEVTGIESTGKHSCSVSNMKFLE